MASPSSLEIKQKEDLSGVNGKGQKGGGARWAVYSNERPDAWKTGSTGTNIA